ncbi:hypothetical protein CEXT_53241 [Caerostris extrusa]|uniref:Uncharacterized protein n=1 Tax=Caerostris extrusa TaxID=172846 RepID=A0AAV4XDJ8_CAEEX|nr:hypothetical protein CEXT_53241 [Caerostris extrusa]
MHLTNHLLTQDLGGFPRDLLSIFSGGSKGGGRKNSNTCGSWNPSVRFLSCQNLTPGMEKKGKKGRTKDIEVSEVGRISLRLASLAISRFSQFFEHWIFKDKETRGIRH